MILIFGGAYQGKTEYAVKNFNIDRTQDCSRGERPDFSADCICGIEGFVSDCVKKGVEAKSYFQEHREEWNSPRGEAEEKIFVITDTSQGVVPVDPDVRSAREMNGRLMIYLAEEAREVHRVFCGIGKRIK